MMEIAVALLSVKEISLRSKTHVGWKDNRHNRLHP